MTTSVTVRRKLRRYPALGFLAAAALLASLLPSALRVPLSGPSASAELAPVPGKSDAAQGDLAALGETSNGGLGSGSGLGVPGGGRDGSSGGDDGLPPASSPPPGSGRNPSEKQCVGDPPRQTEDPLSPPCVAYFKGDNGGATAKGVTAEEIIAVHQQNVDETRCEGVFTDYDDPDDPDVDQVVAAYVRHFNKRFQTYGRRVHMYGVRPACDMTREAFIHEVDQRYRPFFILNGADLRLTAARLGIIGTTTHPKRAMTSALPPYVLSFPPDLEDHLDSAAEFLCARLAGRPARFATDPTFHDTQRKFGLLYYRFDDEENEGARRFLDRVRERCGSAAGDIVVGTTSENLVPQDVARMRQAGVTTVVMLEETTAPFFQAEAAKWYPEWYMAGFDFIVGDNTDTRLLFPPAQARGAFGIMSKRRLGAFAEQPHVVALRDGCGSCTGTIGAFSLGVYNDLLMLFWGIQAAGPRLTPANLDKGLHAIPARQSLDPFTPAAYFAPGNYSFVKDWATVWWDPAGRPPGTNQVGCWRLVEDGLRYRAEDWQKRPGDEGIQGQGLPCQGDDN